MASIRSGRGRRGYWRRPRASLPGPTKSRPEFTEFTEFTDASKPSMKAFTDDAGMSKDRLSSYNAYYHRLTMTNFKLYSFRFKFRRQAPKPSGLRPEPSRCHVRVTRSRPDAFWISRECNQRKTSTKLAMRCYVLQFIVV